jgi:cytochrome c oxidase assembly protein subunit 15
VGAAASARAEGFRGGASPGLVRRLALASLLANIGIVLTGGAVRLTGSGLGCPTWPTCTDQSFTVTPEMGFHGVIEFGNRMLGGVVGLIAVAVLLATLWMRPRRPALVRLATGVLAGVALQGAVGGVSVWTDLNPWVVAGHFLASMVVIALAYALWRRVDEPDGPTRPTVPRPLRGLAWTVVASGGALIILGTVVTGSGPHAGDADVPRNGLDPETLAHLHADLAFLLAGLAVAAWFGLRATAAPAAAVRASAWLVAVILAQGAVGFVQYYTDLPELLVWLHLLGATLLWLAIVHLLHATRVREPAARSATPEHDRARDPAPVR